MADETSVAAGKRFSQDLRRIREDRGVSIEEVRKETRIARSLIESFEEGGLYDHETFNEVYLRSFVRAYAEAVGISPDRVRTELDAALEGTYQNVLADEYLSESSPSDDTDAEVSGEAEGEGAAAQDQSPTPDQSPPPPPEAGGPEGRGGIVGPAREVGDEDAEEIQAEEEADQPSSDASEEDDTSQPADSGAEEQPSDPASEEDSSKTSTSDSPATETESTDEETKGESDGLSKERRPSWMDEGGQGEAPPVTDQSEGVRDAAGVRGEGEALPPQPGEGETGVVGPPTPIGEDGGERQASRPGTPASTSPPSRASRRSGWRQWFQGEQRELMWAGIGFVVVFFVLVGLAIAFFTGESAPTSQQAASATTAPATDTAASPQDTTASSPPDRDRPPPADVTLGSTIPLTVRATNGVQGIRIERDEDLARPYWIEDGEAAVFPFQNRVILENELDDVQLFLAGYPYPESQWDTTGLFVITRSEVEAFVDTLRGAPAALTTTPDTIPKGPPDQ